MRRTEAFCFLLLGLLGCGGDTTAAPKGGGSSGASETSLVGAGATFPKDILQVWFDSYRKAHADVRINYQGLGSSAGINKIVEETVDFAASDTGMTDAEIGKVKRGVQLIPVTAGNVAVAYNLPELKAPLKLTREALIGIFMGKIAKWNDPAIAKDNPDAPTTPVSIIWRSDGSGTTSVFTSHLAAVSPEWKKSPGAGKSVTWPKGTGAKGNDGVAAQVKQIPGAIGYMELGYAKSGKLGIAHLQNRAGKFVEPTLASGTATLGEVKLDEAMRGWSHDPAGEDCYPVATYSWLILFKQYPDAAKSKSLRDAIRFCLTEGQARADGLHYLPLPKATADLAVKALDNVKP